MENVTVLGISIGTRQCGIAVVKNGMLIDWKVKNYRDRISDNKLIRISYSIEILIKKYGVKYIGCKVPNHMRTIHIDYLLDALKDVSSKTGITINLVSLEELKLEELPKICNREIYAAYLAKKFPELQQILLKHKKLKTGYYIKVFEAVGAAYNYINNLQNEFTKS